MTEYPRVYSYENNKTLGDKMKDTYGVFWRDDLTLEYDKYLGIYGDETIIANLKTGESRARRVLYYSESGKHEKNKKARRTYCDEYRPESVESSYYFISKALPIEPAKRL